MRRFFIVISGVLSLLFNECTTEKEQDSSYFEGAWNAEWFLKDKEIHSMFSPEEITMHGQVFFKEDMTVEITAYGFEGCVFAADTATNTLRYEFQDTLLNLVNSDKEVIFSYQVKEKLPDKITLLLMEDIQLTLYR